MRITLGIMAGFIFLVYSPYFFRIIKGDPGSLEIEMLQAMADWIIRKKTAAHTYIWGMFAASVLAEAIYFYTTWSLIANPVMRLFTGLLILFEVNHLLTLGLHLHRFFTGQYLLSQIFLWSLERASAVLFFTHAFMVLAILAALS